MPKIEISTSRQAVRYIKETMAIASIDGATVRVTVPGWDERAAIDALADLMMKAHAAAVAAREAVR